MTVPGQWAAEHVGRRRMLLAGALLVRILVWFPLTTKPDCVVS